MGSEYSCFGQAPEATKNTFENGVDIAGKPEEEAKNVEIEQKEPDYKRIQAVARGHLARKQLQPALFEKRDLRTWVKVEDNYQREVKPLSELLHHFVGTLEKDLKPLDIKRPEDGVKVMAKPALKLHDGSVYEGEWDKEGKKHGVGTLIKEDGSKIVGVFKAGILDGMARMIQSTGLVFEGEFKNGELHGNGKIQNKTGAKFDGELENGKLHGKGVEEWPDGTKYDGEYMKGLKHGQGKLTLPDGSTYAGNFKEDQMSGEGELRYKNGNTYKGKWKKSKMNGYGVFRWADGRVYEGEFQEDLKHGKGKMTWTDGKVYDGEWKEGKQHGEGSYTYKGKDGKHLTRKSRWEEGSRVEWIKD